MRRFNGLFELKYKALVLCLFMVIYGCSGGSGSDKETSILPTQSSTVSDKAVIGSSTGGAISVETKSGLSVMVDIPAEAMEYSREITLSVDQDDETGDVSIEILPSMSLAGQASLVVIFPSEDSDEGRIICRNASGPLKQGMTAGTITSSIYRLGQFAIEDTDEGALLDMALDVIGKSPDGSWQDAYETFDSLIWLSDYFSRQGLALESVNCFSNIVAKSRESVDVFLVSLDKVEKGTPDYTALQKFQNLMALCENPDQILSVINSLLAGVEEE